MSKIKLSEIVDNINSGIFIEDQIRFHYSIPINEISKENFWFFSLGSYLEENIEKDLSCVIAVTLERYYEIFSCNMLTSCIEQYKNYVEIIEIVKVP